MNQFIEECRREWKRLRVPDLVADEMAADLATDLEEAEAEGASPEEVLGSGAPDPRAFAASWAAERGVIPPPRWTGKLRARSVIQLAVAALAIVAAAGAALVVFASPHAASIPGLPLPPSVTTVSPGDGRVVWVQPQDRMVVTQDPMVVTLLQPHSSGVEIHTVGSILLIAGIAGVILAMLLLFWSSRRLPMARP